MKRLSIILAVALLLISSVSHGFMIIPGKKLIRVASGSFTLTNARVSYVNGTAFWWINGTDLSSYAGADSGSHQYYAVISDGSKTARGYLGAVGGGEALGASLIVNGDMELDSNWSNYAPVTPPLINERSNEQAHAGTYSRKFSTSSVYTGIQSDAFTVVAGTLYKFDFETFPVAPTDFIGIRIREGNGSTMMCENLLGSMTPDTWNNNTGYCVSEISGASAVMQINSSGSATERVWYEDDASFKPLTDCAATGVHILSTQSGSTQNWTSVESGFDYNAAGGYTYTIYRVR